MIKGSILSEYVKNPFFIWGLLTLFLTKFNSAMIANKIMQAIWVQQFYLLIIFPALIITVTLLVYPIRRGFTEYVKKKENKPAGVIFILTIMMLFMVEVPIFFTDVLQIMSVQMPQMIIDKERLDYYLNAKDLLAFLAIPLLSFIVFRNMKSELAKKGFSYEDKPRNNLKFILSSIVWCVVFTGIAGLMILK